jgi:hypothetical protein
MQAQHYTVGLTLAVEADTGQLAIETARVAGMSLQGSPGIAHASIDAVAVPLFDSQPFAQMRGQMGFES